MSKKLVAYFSASGITAKVAERLSESIGDDLHEITPKVRYTEADLDWRDKNSRSSVEMSNPASRPEIERIRENTADYQSWFISQNCSLQKALNSRNADFRFEIDIVIVDFFDFIDLIQWKKLFELDIFKGVHSLLA